MSVGRQALVASSPPLCASSLTATRKLRRTRARLQAITRREGPALSAFYGAYRADGHGRAAYEPSLMVALILYAFSSRVRSSRVIECRCRQDVAYRVITGNLVPDHATIARFICRHERALAELFSEVLKLCDGRGGEAGGGVDRRHQDRGQRQPGGQLPVRADRARDRRRGQGDRRGRGRSVRRGAW